MGVRITVVENVAALFDSVTGRAFHVVFDDAQDAADFLDHVRLVDGRDPRTLSPAELETLHRGWVASREAA